MRPGDKNPGYDFPLQGVRPVDLGQSLQENIYTLVLEFIPATYGYHECVLGNLRAGHYRCHLPQPGFGCICTNIVLPRLRCKTVFKTVRGNNIGTLFEEMGALGSCYIGNSSEYVRIVCRTPFEGVFGYYIEFLYFVPSIVTLHIVVQRESVPGN
ncbi:hypothetical protein SDC9_98258 [bioreactor metagenome]|uniref:Uncharacterized protein n=1 Tax=bioreactor metagenome TaxID=1076179 RepID=A0A645AEA1_9ZZZZ